MDYLMQEINISAKSKSILSLKLIFTNFFGEVEGHTGSEC